MYGRELDDCGIACTVQGVDLCFHLDCRSPNRLLVPDNENESIPLALIEQSCSWVLASPHALLHKTMGHSKISNPRIDPESRIYGFRGTK
ncbi:hypothetical protein Z043_114117 [Scleropages formosus]|uniref:Uncharacterized protein n=1 Tax=Scleropages formosus TaxID=113540 RepID=A0A0P7U034_SCLFO|nr:hypothetical protein Z043_114117 [Scleropages formosus]